MAQQDLVQKFRDHIDAFNAKDWSRYGAMMTDKVHYEEEATHRTADGRDTMIKLLDQWKNAFPDLKGSIKEVVAGPDRVVAEMVWDGTHKGTLSGPMGSLAATNRHGKLPAVVVATFDNGLISSIHHYFDLMTLLQQLGVGPQAVAAPPPAP